MTAACLAFALGAALLQWQPDLPSGAWAVLLLPLGILGWLKPRTLMLFTFALGFFWAALLAHHRMADWLAPELEGRDVRVGGVVAGLPASGERGRRFEPDVESADAPLPKKRRVAWCRRAVQQGNAGSRRGAVG